jgi:hypothetical protein
MAVKSFTVQAPYVFNALFHLKQSILSQFYF